MSERTATLDPNRRLALVIAAWLAVAALVGASGAISRAPVLIPLLAGSALIAGLVADQLTGVLRSVEPRLLIALHLVRVPIGALFLVQMSRGNLPELFAMRAGVGDIAVGLLAVGLLARPGRAAIVAWSVLGILDLAVVVGTAQYLVFVVRDPQMLVIGGLPYAVIPLMVVPLLLVSHVALIRRGR